MVKRDPRHRIMCGRSRFGAAPYPRGGSPGAVVLGVCLIASSFIVFGCSRQEDNGAGRGLLPPSITGEASLRDTTFVGAMADTDYQFSTHLAPSGGSTRLVAAEEDVFDSTVLIRFGLLPAAGWQLRQARVWLSVRSAEPATDPPRLSAYELYEGFSEGLTGEDTFPAHASTPLAEGVFTEAAGDTSATFLFAGESVTSLFREWMNDTTRVNAGLMLALSPGGAGRVEFYSREAAIVSPDVRPRAELLLVSSGDSTGTDTTYWLPDRDTFLATRAGPAPAGDPGRLTVGTAVPTRSLLRFDVVPSLEHAVVHRASLTLNVDRASSKLDTLYLRADLVADYPWSGEETLARSGYSALAVAQAESTSVTFELVSMAREWVMGESANTGVRLRAAAEGEGLSWVRFFSSAGPDSLRPRLELTVSPPPGE